MRLPRLEYPKGQPFVIPHINKCFYATSPIIITFLVVLNTALTGNDIVTELKKSPDNTDTKWWAPSWLPKSMSIPTTPGPCQPLAIPQNDLSLHTNSSTPLFTYALLNSFGLGESQSGPKRSGSKRVSQALPYRSEPLLNCSVQEITALLDFPTGGFRTNSLVKCNLLSANSGAPQTLKLLTTFSRISSMSVHFATGDIRNYISESPYTVPWPNDVREAHTIFSGSPGEPDLTVLGILDAFGSDLLKAMWAQKREWKISMDASQWPQQAVVKWGSRVNCTSWDKCRTKGNDVEGIEMWYSDTGGAQDYDAEYLTAMNTTLYNYFVMLRDALCLDLGAIDHNRNVFLNPDTFRSQIFPDPFMSKIEPRVVGVSQPGLGSNASVYTAEEFWKTCTWGWGCLNGTWSAALRSNTSAAVNMTLGLPLRSFDSPYSTVIDVNFVCPIFRTKQTASLLVSVFVGTFTMYTALYGMFLFVAPIFDRKYRKKYGIEQLSSDDMSGDDPYKRQRSLLIIGTRRLDQSYDEELCRSKSQDQYGQANSPPVYEQLGTPACALEYTRNQSIELHSINYDTNVPGICPPEKCRSRNGYIVL